MKTYDISKFNKSKYVDRFQDLEGLKNTVWLLRVKDITKRQWLVNGTYCICVLHVYHCFFQCLSSL